MTIEKYQLEEFVYRMVISFTDKTGENTRLRIFASHSYRKDKLCKGAMTSRLKYYQTIYQDVEVIKKEILEVNEQNIEGFNNPGFMPTRIMLPSESNE